LRALVLDGVIAAVMVVVTNDALAVERAPSSSVCTTLAPATAMLAGLTFRTALELVS